jgi:hypothetical protein
MNTVKFARWEIECDPVITRGLFTQVSLGAPEACGCGPCRNFASARNQTYPADARRLFELLGIVMDREAEVYHTHRVAPGQHHYGGWFHFVGTIASGSDAARQIGTRAAWTFDLEEVGPSFKLGFTRRIGLLKEPFHGHPVVQLEFQAEVPWVLAEPEPTR